MTPIELPSPMCKLQNANSCYFTCFRTVFFYFSCFRITRYYFSCFRIGTPPLPPSYYKLVHPGNQKFFYQLLSILKLNQSIISYSIILYNIHNCIATSNSVCFQQNQCNCAWYSDSSPKEINYNTTYILIFYNL
jgi:hypothetical protein